MESFVGMTNWEPPKWEGATHDAGGMQESSMQLGKAARQLYMATDVHHPFKKKTKKPPLFYCIFIPVELTEGCISFRCTI